MPAKGWSLVPALQIFIMGGQGEASLLVHLSADMPGLPYVRSFQKPLIIL